MAHNTINKKLIFRELVYIVWLNKNLLLLKGGLKENEKS